MTTITKNLAGSIVSSRAKHAQSTFYSRLIEKLHFSYFGLISMTILIGSAFGGIAAMYILKDNAPVWQLCINIYITMASNIASIGQAPTKWVVNLFGLSVVANLLLLLAHVM